MSIENATLFWPGLFDAIAKLEAERSGVDLRADIDNIPLWLVKHFYDTAVEAEGLDSDTVKGMEDGGIRLGDCLGFSIRFTMFGLEAAMQLDKLDDLPLPPDTPYSYPYAVCEYARAQKIRRERENG